jgi:hypothetical protein
MDDWLTNGPGEEGALKNFPDDEDNEKLHISEVVLQKVRTFLCHRTSKTTM